MSCRVVSRLSAHAHAHVICMICYGMISYGTVRYGFVLTLHPCLFVKKNKKNLGLRLHRCLWWFMSMSMYASASCLVPCTDGGDVCGEVSVKEKEREMGEILCFDTYLYTCYFKRCTFGTCIDNVRNTALF